VFLDEDDVGNKVDKNIIRKIKDCDKDRHLFISIDDKKIGEPKLIILESRKRDESGVQIINNYKCYNITEFLKTGVIKLICAHLKNNELDIENNETINTINDCNFFVYFKIGEGPTWKPEYLRSLHIQEKPEKESYRCDRCGQRKMQKNYSKYR
jgi:hypothetical protein